MKTAFVYRVVDSHGEGMYMGTEPLPFAYSSDRHPSPNRDEVLMKNLTRVGLGGIGADNHRYAFRTIKQLKRWVPESSHREMRKTGFRVKKIRVPVGSLAVGDTQVIYDSGHEKVVKYLGFDQL